MIKKVFLKTKIKFFFSDLNRTSEGFMENDQLESNKLSQVFYFLKDREIFSIGKTESFVMASLGIMIFSWTPWLQSSTIMEFNIGYFYICMILGRIIGVTLYELIIINLRIHHYLSMSIILFFQSFCFLGMFIYDNLFLRIMIVCFLEVN